jgi:hypothetical protein
MFFYLYEKDPYESPPLTLKNLRSLPSGSYLLLPSPEKYKNFIKKHFVKVKMFKKGQWEINIWKKK